MPLTSRNAIKMIIEAGGSHCANGAEHDIYQLGGTKIQIPRHAGDLSTGVEMKICKAISRNRRGE